MTPSEILKAADAYEQIKQIDHDLRLIRATKLLTVTCDGIEVRCSKVGASWEGPGATIVFSLVESRLAMRQIYERLLLRLGAEVPEREVAKSA